MKQIQWWVLHGGLLWVVVAAWPCFAATDAAQPEKEPDFETAVTWWEETEKAVTPIGWKHHLFRFNVAYNGIILAEPCPPRPKKHVQRYKRLGVQLALFPFQSNQTQEAIPESIWKDPDLRTGPEGRRVGDQGWSEHETPVLWTRWKAPNVVGGSPEATRPKNSVVLKSEVFSRIHGAREIKSGTEPLFAWIRLSVEEVPEDRTWRSCGFLIRIAGTRPEVLTEPTKEPYPRFLRSEPFSAEGDGLLILEPTSAGTDECVRLGVILKGDGGARCLKAEGDSPCDSVVVELAVRKGAHADLLLPMLPLGTEIFEEISVGYDHALAEADKTWSRQRPATAVKVNLPEKPVQNALEVSLKMADILAERNPETGEYAPLSSSYTYHVLWGTPGAITLSMLMDAYGYHDAVKTYLHLFTSHQGQVKPPGPAFKHHPGYLAVPRSLDSGNDWLTDHGAVLHALAWHALITDDRAFLEANLEPILKACEFIPEARTITDHPGVKGVMPSASATDISAPVQALWSDGWNYFGLTTAIRLLKRIGHPRAVEFEKAAEGYRNAFLAAVQKRVDETPPWRDGGGKQRPMVPCNFQGEVKVNPFYLDTGPLFLVYSGLYKATDPLMQSVLAFFREDPNLRTFGPSGTDKEGTGLIHEMSSCEPCYSWNIFFSHQTGDRNRYLEGMYSLFTGGMSRQTWISSEVRDGVSENLFTNMLAVWLLRLAVVDDQIEKGNLHLLRLAPLAWVKEGAPARFERVPTEFGPINLAFQLEENGRVLSVEYNASYHHNPGTVILHVPPMRSLERVKVNGKDYDTGPNQVLDISKGEVLNEVR